MKLIEIQRHFFHLKGDKNLYFCTEAESHNLNVTVVHYIKANSDSTLPDGWLDLKTQALRGSDLSRIVIDGEGLGMAYRPASEIRKLDTQVPDSMGDDTHAALAKLKKAVGGDVTDFVCERLQWSREDIENRLFAEQVDSVALAIYNMEARNQAMIIGDQTGIGKGRMAACLIRYGHVHGQKPIFVTEKSNLFTDIYRDLKDIGCAELRPFIVNSDDKAKITEIDEDDNIKVVYKPLDSKENKKIFQSQHIPGECDYVLCTYSQFNTPKRDAEKIAFFQEICKGNTIILDEAHNAGGSRKVGFAKTDENGEDARKVEGSNTYKVFANAVQTAKNVCFLSATFAKRPDNFPIFALRTCISESELSNTELINSISKGGEALQEILSSELVSEGQMLRRERTYDGIRVNYIYLNKRGASDFGVPDLEKEHRAMSDIITGLMRDIINFEKSYINPLIDDKNEDMAEEGESADLANKEMGVNRTSYFSKVFNVVNQVLFSIKADAVAEHAIRRLKEDKKVVIACASTFESLYSDLVESNDMARATVGDEVKTDYSEALLRGLQNTLKYTVREGKGKTHQEFIPFSELTEDAQTAYIELEKKIKSATTGITISPIDYIIRKIESAGYRVAEVTGRSQRIEFTNENGTRGRIVPRKKIKANVAFAQFQNNQQDVLIINTSGSTGASAHATNKGTNLKREEVKPRVMIIAQCELNVSTEVQKRGRINRTGQLPEIPPSYDYLISAIPAEARMMMMLQKKLRSLDANTASNQKNSTSVIDTEDFINKYGDEVVLNYMKDNREFTEAINDPCFLFRDEPKNKNKILTQDIAKAISGKVAVLSADEQENFYETVLSNYLQKVSQLKSRGEFDLEVEAMKLDARFVREHALVPRTSGHSIFAEAAYLGTYECNVLRKPYTKEMVLSLLSKVNANGDAKKDAEELADRFRKKIEEDLKKRIVEKNDQRQNDLDAMRKSPRNQKLVESGTRTWIEIENEINGKYDSAIEKIEAEIGKKQLKALCSTEKAV
ncbi:MAG: strawberry notch C-terminal domain-containing protein [Paludibacteraceae bacterium]|nr:strawberry notch C-terminal domain-containing protein [Paludibacteraceae bacterium]